MHALTKYWFLEGFSLFKKLGMPTMMRLCGQLEMEAFNKGAQILHGNTEEDFIYFLKKGTVKIVHQPTGTVKYIVQKGNIFGELALYDEIAQAEEAAFALDECLICYISKEQMERLIEEHSSLKNGVLKIYGLRIRKLERRLHDLLYKDSKTRIQEFIRDYIDTFGEELEKGKRAKKILSHKEIADLTNTSRQTVNNVLSTLRKEGVLQYDARWITWRA